MEEDKATVKDIAMRLKHEHGLKVWFDKWDIVPGTHFEKAMSDGLKESKTCAIFIGKSPPERWCMEEIRFALNRGTKDNSFRVIPVILPGCNNDNIPDFLQSRSFVDFSTDIDSEDEMYRLVCGIQNEPPCKGSGASVRPKLIMEGISNKNMYNVFFGYSLDSLEITEKVANYLTDNDVDVWFDKENSIPIGDRRLTEALLNSYSVAVVVGPGYRDDIFFNNIVQDIEKRIKKKPYIKVILVLFNDIKIKDVPSFLQSYNYIKLNTDSDVADMLSREEHELHKMVVLKEKIASCNKFKHIENYIELIQCYHDTISYAVEIYGYKNPIRSDILKETGIYLTYIGRVKESVNFFEDAIKICIDNYGAFHAKMAELKNFIGLVWSDLRDYNKAFECLYIALFIDKKIFGEKHINVARDYNSIGSVWYELGRKKEALELFKNALEIDTAVYGESHPNVAGDHNNIGSVWDELREKDKALEFYRKALSIFETVYGVDHPHTRKVRDKIAKLNH
ncbi:MAG: toll/interleukin-1 receptor domain-containing protein [Nitrospirae bacterium]|nr:toll/interleukin-1 receptor domain-containing protein [Nitrospirota bacterium]